MFVSIQKNKRQPIGEAASVTNGEYRHPAMRYKGPYIKELDFEGGVGGMRLFRGKADF